jgi:hypothetical protein
MSIWFFVLLSARTKLFDSYWLFLASLENRPLKGFLEGELVFFVEKFSVFKKKRHARPDRFLPHAF